MIKMEKLALLKIAEKLSLDAEGIQTVKLACENPKLYFKTFESQLEERAIEKQAKNIPWIALVDALIEKELAAEIDWKESYPTIFKAVDYLLGQNSLLDFEWSKSNAKSSGLYEEEALDAVASKLKKMSITLAYLDIDSDSYVLITVESGEFEELKVLASEAGFTISNEFI